ncbi:uncharacterized protein QC761_0000330 [Podospora bellae-mahoneyi]|uniref:Heterokaryon incompatibility domain-containing protein n=1 Tax=Podospora bellae-mahoneyi TaxID=2093777 RepID=A0ABR0FX12_9PEZI|nr:hypothetical protein QC761_0000330 [Podospora bellae-mahoneyi]
MRLLTATSSRSSAPSSSTTSNEKHLKIDTVEFSTQPYAILSHTWDEPSEVTLPELPLFANADECSLLHGFRRCLKYLPLVLCIYLLVSGGNFQSSKTSGAIILLLLSTSLFFTLPLTGTEPKSKATGAQNLDRLLQQKKAGYDKIQHTLRLARQHRLRHAWVDTCCIDKTSSSELQEAINSMYAWYAATKVCFVYLSDLDPVSAHAQQQDLLEAALPKCRWFTRGWTLQELIAPEHVIFFDKGWNKVGTKASLSGLLSGITGIPEELLRGKRKLEQYSVAQRLSWASKRETTKLEDMTYCLLGIFRANMSLLYGEGGEKAFYRLQEAILEGTEADRSLFLWTDKDADRSVPWAPVLATSPRFFASAGRVEACWTDSIYSSLSIEPRGIRLKVSLMFKPGMVDGGGGAECALDVGCSAGDVAVGIFVRKISGGRYMRYQPWRLAELGRWSGYRDYQPDQDKNRILVETALFAKRLPEGYTFCDGFNPVIGNRYRALKLRLRPSTPQLTVDRCRALPRTHWDMHDNVFISTNYKSKGWSVFFIHGRLADTERTCIPVNLFLACLRWNTGEPFVLIGSLDDLTPETRVFLEYLLDFFEFESCRKAEAIIRSVFGGKWDPSKREIETSIVTKSNMPPATDQIALLDKSRAFQTNGPTTPSADWHFDVPVGRQKARVEVSVELREKWDHKICQFNPITMLDLRLRVLE